MMDFEIDKQNKCFSVSPHDLRTAPLIVKYVLEVAAQICQ
jgi:hypothetical protein